MFRDRAIQQYFASMPMPTTTVSATKVEPATWTPSIEAIGTVGASRGVDLTVETAGVVKKIEFEANQKVRQGEVLVQLDDAVERADVEAQKAQAAIGAQTLERAQALQRRGVGSDANLDAARAVSNNSSAQVAKLEAVLEQKQLRAPFSGTMGIPRIDAGQYVTPGVTVATLQDLETMRADFSVPEQRLGDLRIGQPVEFGLSGDRFEFHGTITGIEPKVDPTSRLVAVRAEIVDAGGRLSPGQFVQVRVQLPPEDGVLAVPQTALVASLYGDYVYVVRSADAPAAGASEATPSQAGDAAGAPVAGQKLVARQVFVKPGRRDGGRVEITEGLSGGDEVVTAGQNRLINGGPVAVDNSVVPQTSSGAQASNP
ncbi:MAG: efflux RND transporter periplasmic adaptor subunit [Rhizobiaceae bacterium]|nr:efflux RND transporter periplasmic adaptor subunit [Rhizobiaceae bacterium]